MPGMYGYRRGSAPRPQLVEQARQSVRLDGFEEPCVEARCSGRGGVALSLPFRDGDEKGILECGPDPPRRFAGFRVQRGDVDQYGVGSKVRGDARRFGRTRGRARFCTVELTENRQCGVRPCVVLDHENPARQAVSTLARHNPPVSTGPRGANARRMQATASCIAFAMRPVSPEADPSVRACRLLNSVGARHDLQMDKARLRASATRTESSGNWLLDAMLREDRTLYGALEPVVHATGDALYRQDDSLTHVYFPVTGALSLVVHMRNGKAAEVATVGNEGFVGLHAFFGSGIVPHSVLQQAPGTSLRLRVRRFADAVRRHAGVQRLIDCYAAYMLRFAEQSAACATLHPMLARACRYLLVAHDRAGGREFFLTHAMLSEMLGVRRPSVSEVAARLARVGLIEYSRGIVSVKDRRKLEAATCECYHAMQSFYQRMLGRITGAGCGGPVRNRGASP